MRAAIAAVQAMQIRAEGISAAAAPATFQQITLPVTGPTGKNQSVNVTVYGNQPQPFITEVYAQTDTFNQENGLGPNPDGYMAIELYNPYSQDIKLDNSYDIIAVQKSTGTGPYPLTITPVYTFDGSITVPKNNFVVLTNDDALYQPASAGVVKNNHPIPLEKAYDQELIIRRNIGTSASPQYYAVDSFDFTGLRQGRLNLDSLGNEIARLWHYVRAAGPGTNNWKCVYPGRYNGVASSDTTNANSPPRQQGTDEPWAFQESRNAPGWTEKTATDPWAGGPPSTEQHAAFTLGSANDVATYPNVFTIQLPDLNWPGPNSLAAANNQFPFGGFARNGDMLQIPFIGAYTIDNGNGQTAGLIEMNSISMDAAFAEDTDVTDDEPEQGIADTGAQPREQIGRFCPIYHDPVGFAGLLADDYGTNVANYRYAWAKKLFDYLTVQAPQDDYLPNVTTNQATSAGAPAPQAVDNDGDGQANATTAIPPVDTEDAYPVHGLININTAPWRVLAALPIFPTGDANTYNTTTFGWTAGPNPGIDDNAELAQAIVHWRDGDPANNLPGNGPFRSIFDLYNVPAFRNAQHQIFATTAKDPGNADGDFSPVGPTADGTRYDFEEQFLLLNKISNLITTRSDSFTVYVLVQGWKGVGTNNPQLVVQRRAAFIQDRSPVTQTSKSLPAAVSVPNN
jgi:hypothetical protein